MTHARRLPAYFSLGFSCQSRFAIDVVAPTTHRAPFDFNITTRTALLEGLRTKGASFVHDVGTGTPYRMPLSGREGLEAAGSYFWHDYPFTETGALRPDWTETIDAVNQKYAFLWERFLGDLALPGRKRLVLSNTQFNLPEFAASPSDFETKFGIDATLCRDLTAELDRLTDDYDLVCLLRCREAADRLRQEVRDRRLIVRFGGVQALKCDPVIARSALMPRRSALASLMPYLNRIVSVASRQRG